MPDSPRKFRLNQRQPRDTRRTAAERGYDHAWNEFRERRWEELKQAAVMLTLQHTPIGDMYAEASMQGITFPLCARCLRNGRITAARILDHIKPVNAFPALRLVEENTEPLCTACNTAKGKRDAQRYGANR